MVLGLIWTVAYTILLAIPLVVVLAIPAISAAGTIVVYSVGLIADVLVGIVILLIGVGYAARAARGELFSIPVVTPIVDRWIRAKRP